MSKRKRWIILGILYAVLIAIAVFDPFKFLREF